ncbi:MAG: adenylyl-sulfate reductase subunit alpha [Thermodesulfobacteriota bacterium]|nr:adenylyl-sulfate reductase subunit alpha [Thermodesulfobacteriota bacterium]
MALPNKPLGELPAVDNPEIAEHECDILIVGGGMAACGTAFEIKKWAPNAKTILVDKASLERSGAVAQGLSAINTYLGENKPDDYVRMVRNDLMGIVREDLIYDLGRHVDDSVDLFEEWGLPIWKQKGDEGKTLKGGGKPVRSGRWQIMINGESYKCIVAEAAKMALGEENIMERIFIVKLLLDANKPNTIAGAVGFSTRENKVHVFKCKTMMVACGGAVNVFRPRSTGEGMGRAWYPVWNAGSTYTMCAEVGAELTMMENRFVPARFKDGYGPVGAWFLLFKAKAMNALGENYMAKNKAMLEEYPPYGLAKVPATCLRNHLMLKEMLDGHGPIIIDTATALQELGKTMDAKQFKHLEAEAWEDFLDMSVGQAGLWAGTNTEPEKVPSEIMPTEPYLLGSHSGCCGIWVSGPNEDWVPADYKWGYNRMTTVNGLFTSGDGVGASGHKFSSGAHAEGRICAKMMARYIRDNAGLKPTLKRSAKELADEIYKPVKTYNQFKGASTMSDVNPNYIKPKHFMLRLIKASDEYGAGANANYMTSGPMLKRCMELLAWLREDSEKMAAGDLHELMRAWEQYHRLGTVEAHIRHMLFREETRYPGFFYRSDFPKVDEVNWKCFVNSKYDPDKKEWSVFKKEWKQIIPD